MMTLLLFETTLSAYLAAALPDVPVLAGHSNDDMTALPRVIVTVSSSGGQLLHSAGVEQAELQILVLTSSGSVDGDDSPLETVASIADVIRALLAEGNISTVAPAIAETPGVGLCGLEYGGHKEGRDPDRALHGIDLGYTAWVYCPAPLPEEE
jgi:hypothetical protein